MIPFDSPTPHCSKQLQPLRLLSCSIGHAHQEYLRYAWSRLEDRLRHKPLPVIRRVSISRWPSGPWMWQCSEPSDRQFWYRKLSINCFTDALILNPKSRRKNKYAQLFVTLDGWCRTFPMPSKKSLLANEGLSLLFQRDAVPNTIIMDGARQTMMGILFRKKVWKSVPTWNKRNHAQCGQTCGGCDSRTQSGCWKTNDFCFPFDPQVQSTTDPHLLRLWSRTECQQQRPEKVAMCGPRNPSFAKMIVSTFMLEFLYTSSRTWIVKNDIL